jgi:hypothetical protein
MPATGHETRAVFDQYADHVLESGLARVAEPTAEAFSNILSLKTNSA